MPGIQSGATAWRQSVISVISITLFFGGFCTFVQYANSHFKSGLRGPIHNKSDNNESDGSINTNGQLLCASYCFMLADVV